jgi:prefoldin subunit 5
VGPEQEKQVLQQQVQQLQTSMEAIQKRIQELDGNKS